MNIARRQPTLADLIERTVPQMRRVVPAHFGADRMARICLTAIRRTPKLAECTPASFLGAMLSAAALGLEVNSPLGHAYLIPYKRECTLVLGYRGMLELARRSGVVGSIRAVVVREGDDFAVVEGLAPDMIHRPSLAPDRDARQISHVYAVADLATGPVFVWLTKAAIDARRDRGNKGPAWRTDYAAMARKSAVRALFPWIPHSAEIAAAVALDEAAERGVTQSEVYSPEVVDALGEAVPAGASAPLGRDESSDFLGDLDALEAAEKEVTTSRG